MEVDVAKNLKTVLQALPKQVQLVAISKYHPVEYIEAAYAEGQRVFGESHEQEFLRRHEPVHHPANSSLLWPAWRSPPHRTRRPQ